MTHAMLIIVESPEKAKKLGIFFQDRFKVIATYGPICDLKQLEINGEIGIDRETIECQYAIIENSKRYIDGKRTVAHIQDYLQGHPDTAVYLGTDDDREGESLAAFLQHHLDLKNPRRMRFNALTKEQIEHAYHTADTINPATVSARETRRLIDRIVDHTATPFLRQVVNKNTTATNQVQTAIEALIIERERTIRAHQAQTHYTVHLDFGHWQATWQVPKEEEKSTTHKANSEYDSEDTTGHCLNEATAHAITRHRTLLVDTCAETTETCPPPPLFCTLSLIQAAHSILGWTADYTMRTAQKLYEGDNADQGHITYHHTDNTNISPIAAAEIRHWLQKQNRPIPTPSNTFADDTKSPEPISEGIHPTNIQREIAGATDDQRALYTLIRERTLCSQFAPAQYIVKKIVLTDAIHRTEKFIASTRTQVAQGWLTKTAEIKIAQPPHIPSLKSGEMVNVRRAEIETHATQAPPRYTIGTLASKLQALGIGTPDTIATHLKNIQAQGAVSQDKDKNLHAARSSENCYDALYPRFLFAHIGYAIELEQALDKIANGTLDGKSLTRTIWNHIDIALTNAK